MVPFQTDTRGAAACGVNMAARFIVTTTTMWMDIQMQSLVRLQHLAQREIEAGWQPLAVKFHDFLNALASAKKSK